MKRKINITLILYCIWNAILGATVGSYWTHQTSGIIAALQGI